MSRAHYEQELRNTMEAKKSKTKGQTCPSVDAKCLLQFPFSENPFVSLTEESILSVSVGDEKLPHMTQESHIEVCHDPHTTGICVFCAAPTPLNVHVSLQALHSALHTFDMIESVLVRIEELTEAKEGP